MKARNVLSLLSIPFLCALCAFAFLTSGCTVVIDQDRLPKVHFPPRFDCDGRFNPATGRDCRAPKVKRKDAKSAETELVFFPGKPIIILASDPSVELERVFRKWDMIYGGMRALQHVKEFPELSGHFSEDVLAMIAAYEVWLTKQEGYPPSIEV